jgi:hypothetical protein
MVIGRVAKMDEARVLADALFYTDPYRVKRWHNVWGKADAPTISLHNVVLNEDAGYFVLERVPEYMELTEQLELAAQKLTRLGLFEFLFRPATREGEVSQSVLPISIADYLRDTKNGELQFPNQERVNRYRASLAARVGIPVAKILKEQKQRLLQGTPREQQQEPRQQVRKVGPLAAPDGADGNGRKPTEQQPVRRAAGAQPESQQREETQSHPSLNEKEQALLHFIVTNPDVAVTQVYKGIGVGVALGIKIRDSLKAKGLVEELEVRTSSVSGGRPIKCLIPTFAALELLGKAALVGRGGILHRHVQQVVQAGASKKGYGAKGEYALPTGGIVDVHLENGQEKIAVEIAIASTPEREISHMRNCLAVGYDKVYTIFADEHLLGRTAMLMQNAFSEEELRKIRLLPLRQLAQVV